MFNIERLGRIGVVVDDQQATARRTADRRRLFGFGRSGLARQAYLERGARAGAAARDGHAAAVHLDQTLDDR